MTCKKPILNKEILLLLRSLTYPYFKFARLPHHCICIFAKL